jgi:hypothetical protein
MKDLLKAIGLAKADFPPIVKDAKNPHFKNTYATLGAILSAVEMPLIKQAVVIVHEQIQTDAGWLLQTSLIHWESEQSIKTVFPVTGNDPQKLGSALTYARRYNILNLLNLSTEDDDGNAAMSHPVSASNSQPAISASQLKLLMATASERNMTDEQQKAIVSGQFGFASRKHVTIDKFDQVLSAYKSVPVTVGINPEDIPY